MYDFGEDVVSFESLTHQHTVISLEAVVASQVFNANPTRLPRFLSDTMLFLKNKLSIFSPTIHNVDTRKLERFMTSVDYIAMSSLPVVVPERFSGNWLDYTTTLAKAHELVMPLKKDLLDPFEVFLGVALTNPEHMKSLGNLSHMPRATGGESAALAAEFAAAFRGKPNDQLNYGNVVRRHADVREVGIGLNNLNNDFATLSRTEVVKKVTAISILLGKFNELVKDPASPYAMSGTFVKALSDLTYAVARDVEYYTIYGYRLESFTISVQESLQKLVRMLEH